MNGAASALVGLVKRHWF